MVSVLMIKGQKWILHPWKPLKRVQTHQNQTRNEHFRKTLRFHLFWTLKTYFGYFCKTMVVFWGQKWIPHPWKPPKRVQEHQNRTKKQRKCRKWKIWVSDTQKFLVYPLGVWLAYLLSSSQRAVTLVKIQSTTNT